MPKLVNSSTEKMQSMKAYNRCLLVSQLQSKFDKTAFHRDLIMGMELQEKNPRVNGYQNEQVLHKQPPETPDERRFLIFVTHEFIRSGPYVKDGSWIH